MTAYALNEYEDAWTARVRGAVQAYLPVANWTTTAIAQHMAAHRVDVAVDLNGYGAVS